MKELMTTGPPSPVSTMIRRGVPSSRWVAAVWAARAVAVRKERAEAGVGNLVFWEGRR